MAEQVPAEAWQGDVIGPLVPQRRFATAPRSLSIAWSTRKKIDATISRYIRRYIEYKCDQLMGTTRDKNDKLLVVDVDRTMFNINSLY